MVRSGGGRAVSPHSLKALQSDTGVFLQENIAADISSTGKDNLGKSAGKCRFCA
jgi:hypothetical protein